jgi:hypothetical protein
MRNSKKRVLKESGIPQGSAMSAVLIEHLPCLTSTMRVYVKRNAVKKGLSIGGIATIYLVICSPEMVNDLKELPY